MKQAVSLFRPLAENGPVVSASRNFDGNEITRTSDDVEANARYTCNIDIDPSVVMAEKADAGLGALDCFGEPGRLTGKTSLTAITPSVDELHTGWGVVKQEDIELPMFAETLDFVACEMATSIGLETVGGTVVIGGTETTADATNDKRSVLTFKLQGTPIRQIAETGKNFATGVIIKPDEVLMVALCYGASPMSLPEHSARMYLAAEGILEPHPT